MKTVLKSF